MATLHPFKPQHLTAALGLWNRTLGAEFPLRWELLVQNTVADPNFCFPGSFLAEWQGEPVGCVFTKRQQVPIGNVPVGAGGNLSAIVVAPGHQGHGVGRKLITAALDALRADGVTSVRLGADTGHFFPGVPEGGPKGFFEKFGFKLETSASVDLTRDLAGYTVPARVTDDLARAGAEVRRGQDGDFPAILAFMRREFPGRWTYELEQYIARGGHPRDYMLLWKDGQVEGFARIYDWQSRPVIGPSIYWAPLLGEQYGGLGPMGVSENIRKYGLGLAVLATAVKELQERGVRGMAIDWTGLVGFYGRIGFQPWKRYYMGRREQSL